MKQNVFRSLDPKTGRPDVDPARKPGTGKKAEICPSHWGGKNWPPIAFSPKTRMIYIPANENLCDAIIGRGGRVHRRRKRSSGATSALLAGAGRRSHRRSAGVERGHRRARVDAHVPDVRELGTDAGHRRRTGVQRRHERSHVPRVRCDQRQAAVGVPDQFRHPGPADVVPIDGKQYIAVQSGWGIDSRGMQGRLDRISPGRFPEVPEGGTVWVFAVK